VTLINIAYSGFAYSSSSHPWYSPNNAFDGTNETWWAAGHLCSINQPADLLYRWTDNSFLVTQYSLLLDATNRPVNWTLQGSNDGVVWDDLNEQTAQTSDRLRWETYDISNTGYYSYYRLLITECATLSVPVRVYEFNLLADSSTITTNSTTTTGSSTTISSTSTTSQSTTQTSTSTTLSSSTISGSTHATSTFTSFTTTMLPDNAILWPADSKLDEVRDNFNEWYDKGIPLGVKQVAALPPWTPSYEGNIVFLTTKSEYYLATVSGWEKLNLGNIPHASQHGTGQPDELIHIGPSPPTAPFVGKLWVEAVSAPSTVSTTTTSTTTTTTTLTSTTESTISSGSSTESTTGTTSYTFTPATSTVTTYSTTTITTITQVYYPTNVALGAHVSADSHEIGYEPEKAIDDNLQTEWLSNYFMGAFPHWIDLILLEPAAVHSYGIYWDSQRYAYRWVVEASNNRIIWDQLDFRDSQTPFLNDWNYYFFNNTLVYQYYRLRFMQGSDVRTNSIAIYGLELYSGGQAESTTQSTTTQTTSTSTTTESTTSASTTQLGYQNIALDSIVVASDEYPSYPVNNVIDDNEESYWICDPYTGPPYWIEFYWSDSRHYVVDQYRFYSTTQGRPMSWKLQGSSGNGNWIDIDTRLSMDVSGWFEATLSNVTSYSHYRFLIVETHSSGYSVRVGNIELWVNQAYRSTTTTESTTTTTSTGTTESTSESSTESTQTTTSTSSASSTVPIPTETRLIVNFNGTEGSYQSDDETGRHSDIIWFENAEITTTKSKYGTGSLVLTYPQYRPTDSVIDSYLEIASSPDWRLGDGQGNFTIDFWILMNNNQNLWRNWNTVVSCVQSIDTYWALRYYPEANLMDFTLRVNGSIKISYLSQVRLIENQFNHIALVRSGNLFKLYQQGIACNVGQVTSVTFPLMVGPLWIGRGPSEYLNTSRSFCQGVFWLDSLRISNGVLFTANFTPPGEPTTSTTLSTTTQSSTTTAPVTYETRLVFKCDDGGYYLYDFSGRHGVAALSGTNTTFTGQFFTTDVAHVVPKFGTTLFSASTQPLDWSNTQAGYITMSNHADWRLGDDGTGDFTIEMWVAFKERTSSMTTPLLSQYQDDQNFWAIYCDYRNRKFNFIVRSLGSYLINYEADINYTNFDWNYFGFVRRTGQLNIYWQGVAGGIWEDYSSIVIPGLAGQLIVFGGPSLINLQTIVPSEMGCSGVKITHGVVNSVIDGVIPEIPFS
jgi:hypothetical protein